MYGWLWRSLPGPVPVRVLLVAVLALVVVAVLFQVVFPALAPLVPVNDGTVERTGATAARAALAAWGA